MKIGCPKEIKPQEFRVGMTPDAVREAVAHGHEVVIEAGAGIGAGFADADYVAAGGRILGSAEEVFGSAEHLEDCHLPALPQAEFDTLLWTCHLNLVRGEDSAVRALWAGRPHVWHIYPQDDGVHADKLHAFMARWMDDWPPELRDSVSAWWAAWNGLAGASGVHGAPGDAPSSSSWSFSLTNALFN